MWWILAACDSEPGPSAVTLDDVTLVWSEAMPTVARITFTTDVDVRSAVRVEGAAGEAWETGWEVTPGRDHAIVVAGMGPESEWTFTPVVEVDGEVIESHPLTGTSGAVAGLSKARPEVVGAMKSVPFVLQGLLGRDTSSVIFNAAGEEVWASPNETDATLVRPRLSWDGTTVISASFGEQAAGAPGEELFRITLEGEELGTIPPPDAHHDFTQSPDGFVYIATDARNLEPYGKVYGDRLVEVDADGNVLRTVWDTWDQWTCDGVFSDDGFYKDGNDWTHVNSVEYLPERDQFMVSVHNFHTVLFLDRESGTLVEQIGGADSDYTLTSGTAFQEFHSPELVGDVLSVFDNTIADTSSVRSYQIDGQAKTYAELSSTPNPAETYVAFLGDVARAEDGTRLASWGQSGLLTETDPSGAPTFTATLPMGNAFGFFVPLPILGGPAPAD